MKKLIIFLITLINAFTYQGCSGADPRKEDFIGEWKSDDGSRVIFLNNNTFITKNLSGEKMFDGFEKFYHKRYNESGIWAITKKEDNWIIQLMFDGSKELPTNFFTQIYIGGEKGIASDRPPWYLYKYIGDPDEGIMYEFYNKNASD